MKLQFLSVNGWRPDREEEDTVSLLINDTIMIDTGWNCVRNLLRAGKTPRDVSHLLFTHMHQDHYLSLPAFLFYLLNSYQDASTVSIYGPGRVEEVVDQSLTFAGRHIYYESCPSPAVRRLCAGDSLVIGSVRVDTCPSRHAVEGLCYRFTDLDSGSVCVYTGDTAPTDAITSFSRGCDVLIHEQSYGIDAPSDRPNSFSHSTVREAAECARDAGAGRLFLVHCPSSNRDESLSFARGIFPEAYRPENESVLMI